MFLEVIVKLHTCSLTGFTKTPREVYCSSYECALKVRSLESRDLKGINRKMFPGIYCSSSIVIFKALRLNITDLPFSLGLVSE